MVGTHIVPFAASPFKYSTVAKIKGFRAGALMRRSD